MGRPRTAQSVPLNPYCPSHPTVPTDKWDRMGHPTQSHLPLNPYCPSHPTVPTDRWDCMGRLRTSHSVPFTSQSLLSIPSHCTNNRQMGLHGMSQDIPPCPISTSQSLLSIPSHCTNRQMGSHSVPCLPLNSSNSYRLLSPQSQLHVYTYYWDKVHNNACIHVKGELYLALCKRTKKFSSDSFLGSFLVRETQWLVPVIVVVSSFDC